MADQITGTGICGTFTSDELECLVVTAGDAVFGDPADLSAWQRDLARRIYDIVHADLDNAEPEDELDGADLGGGDCADAGGAECNAQQVRR